MDTPKGWDMIEGGTEGDVMSYPLSDPCVSAQEILREMTKELEDYLKSRPMSERDLEDMARQFEAEKGSELIIKEAQCAQEELS